MPNQLINVDDLPPEETGEQSYGGDVAAYAVPWWIWVVIAAVGYQVLKK